MQVEFMMKNIKQNDFFYIVHNKDDSINVFQDVAKLRQWIVQEMGCKKIVKAQAFKIIGELKVNNVTSLHNVIKFPKPKK
jgi:hypothetical protein